MGIQVLSRRPEQVIHRWEGRVAAQSDLYKMSGPFDWLVNLAGEGIADQRWSEARKQVLRDSRIGVTDNLASWAKDTGQCFDVVMSGSAIGIYGSFDGTPEQQTVTESSPEGEDFAAQLCRDWEYAAMPLADVSNRLVLMRTGLVWGERAGMLKRLWFPFSMGMGRVISICPGFIFRITAVLLINCWTARMFVARLI